MRALVVDNSKPSRSILVRVLRDLKFDCTEATNGLEAIAALATQGRPDLVTIDWHMPVMNGLDFLRQLRSEPGGDAPKVVFCTVENAPEQIRQALDAGATEYIMKPFDGDIVASKFALAGLL